MLVPTGKCFFLCPRPLSVLGQTFGPVSTAQGSDCCVDDQGNQGVRAVEVNEVVFSGTTDHSSQTPPATGLLLAACSRSDLHTRRAKTGNRSRWG